MSVTPVHKVTEFAACVARSFTKQPFVQLRLFKKCVIITSVIV